jgi:hypothetical protein
MTSRLIIKDIPVSEAIAAKPRRDWGTQNLVGLDTKSGPKIHTAQQNVRHKIAKFIQRAVYPQQLSVPRQYASTQQGTFIYKIMEGRIIDGFQEQGARVVVQENARMARFVMSPLFSSKHDALSWARQQMGASHGNI